MLNAPHDEQLSQKLIFEIGHRAVIATARAAAKRKDILLWGKLLFPQKFTLPFCDEFHGHLVKSRLVEFSADEGPRNHAKTIIACFLIPIFQALEEPETFDFYLNVQATASKAIEINRSMKTELEENAVLREIYGNQIGPRWTDQQFIMRNGVAFAALGAGQSVRGVQIKNRRPNYLLCDDLYDEDHINNPDATMKVNAWFWGSLYPARAKGRQTVVKVLGTAINQYDLLEELKKTAGVIHKTFRAVTDWGKKTALWPALNSFEQLEKDRERMGSVIFERELQNERRDDASSIIKEEWLEGWEFDPDELRFTDDFVAKAVLIGCDPSIGEKNESDYTGMALAIETTWKDGRGTDYWIWALVNEHLSLHRRIEALEKLAAVQPKGLPLNRAHIEGIAGFKDFVAEVRRKTNIPVREVDKVPDKITHLENKSHFFENRKVHLNKNIERKLKDALKHQLTTNHPKNDDLRDGLLQLLPSTKTAPRITVLQKTTPATPRIGSGWLGLNRGANGQ